MFFPQEPRLKGGGPNVAPPPPHLAPLSPAASLPPCTPGAERCPGTAPRGRGSHLGARSILPVLGGGGLCPPLPSSHTLGYSAPPPRPHSSYLWVLLGSPSNKGLGLPWLRGRDRGPYGGALPCTPPARTAPGGGRERLRGARSRAFIGVGRARSCSGLPRPWPRRRLWGAWRGGRYEKSRGSELGAPPTAPQCAKKEQPGAGRWGPGG